MRSALAALAAVLPCTAIDQQCRVCSAPGVDLAVLHRLWWRVHVDERLLKFSHQTAFVSIKFRLTNYPALTVVVLHHVLCAGTSRMRS